MGINSGLDGGHNPAEQYANQEQQRQALAALQRLSTIMRPQQEHTPILKSLEAMGVKAHFTTVLLGDIPTDCIVIPKQELMVKEYAYMSGVTVEQLEGNRSGEANPEMG